MKEDDILFLGLFLDRNIIETLNTRNPFIKINNSNFSGLILLVESISHFIWVAYRHQEQIPIPCLELEILAEIDKFTIAWLLLQKQSWIHLDMQQWLMRTLFDQAEFIPQANWALTERYWIANKVAWSFLAKVTSSSSHAVWVQKKFLVNSVRAFAHLSINNKMRILH